MTDFCDRGRFLVDTITQQSAFGELVRWRVDDLEGDADGTGLAFGEETARLAAMTHLVASR